ncbi:SDR family oxidoreductase [Microbacterium invictum]|uniref:NmrA family NAD(P)-binding protein n=1 Tax=Microbacterium invictum TaxID=515415 RepID=A0ABZ0V7W9_9MICO|nr:NmrA family NAD(P)-binding protein [Microbacterium invictum]WQB69715.1 NmrA family NAD(P)-binding protein [Microbacterium invictum]
MARITVIGGTGLIGRKVVARLRTAGHDVRAASPSTGVDLVTGAGLDAALAGSSVVIDVSKPRTYDPDAVWRHFDLATRTLVAAEARAGVIHHVALSAVGTERVPQPIPFYRAKAHGEAILREESAPFSVVRATQFFEFGAQIGAQARAGGTDAARVADADVQPIAGDDVAAVLAGLVDQSPTRDAAEIAGPEVMTLADFVSRCLAATGDARPVLADPEAQYFGALIDRSELLPAEGAWLAPTRLADWLG